MSGGCPMDSQLWWIADGLLVDVWWIAGGLLVDAGGLLVDVQWMSGGFSIMVDC